MQAPPWPPPARPPPRWPPRGRGHVPSDPLTAAAAALGVATQFGAKRTKKRRRERPPKRSETSLLVLIQALVERKLAVELRNDVLLKGTLDDVDEYMNLSMSAVTCQTAEGIKREYESLYVKGRNIRFVHLPKNLDPARAIEAHRQKIIAAKILHAKERARELGSGKRAAKGADAATYQQHEQDEQQVQELREFEYDAGGDGGGVSEGAGPSAGLSGARAGPLGLLDPRAAATASATAAAAGSRGSSAGLDEGYGSDDLYYSSSDDDRGEGDMDDDDDDDDVDDDGDGGGRAGGMEEG